MSCSISCECSDEVGEALARDARVRAGEKPPSASVDVRFYKAGDYWAFRRFDRGLRALLGKASWRVKPSLWFTTSKVAVVWSGSTAVSGSTEVPDLQSCEGPWRPAGDEPPLQYMRCRTTWWWSGRSWRSYAAHKDALATLLD